MTSDQVTMARALAQVVMVPGIGTKRFARDLRATAENKPEHALTQKQDAYLRAAVVRFRRQIPAAVVDLARGMP